MLQSLSFFRSKYMPYNETTMKGILMDNDIREMLQEIGQIVQEHGRAIESTTEIDDITCILAEGLYYASGSLAAVIKLHNDRQQ